MLEYVGILITPQAIADGVADAIIDDLTKMTGMDVLWHRYWRVGTESVFDQIYPSLVDKPFRGMMVRNLTSGESLVILASGEGLSSKLKQVKGKFRYYPDGTHEVSGLRLKYMQPHGNVDDNTISDFRFHTTDTRLETITLIGLCANLQEIAKIAPELFTGVR